MGLLTWFPETATPPNENASFFSLEIWPQTLSVRVNFLSLGLLGSPSGKVWGWFGVGLGLVWAALGWFGLGWLCWAGLVGLAWVAGLAGLGWLAGLTGLAWLWLGWAWPPIGLPLALAWLAWPPYLVAFGPGLGGLGSGLGPNFSNLAPKP